MRTVNPKLLILLCAFVYQSWLSAQELRFNEVMSSNQLYLTDADGDTPDWFELYNSGTSAVNLNQYSVGDDLDSATAWVFPDYMLNAGEYLLLFASGKDRKDPPYYWRTLIDQGDTWRYLVPTSEPDPNWKNISFIDANWPSGESGFGYGDGDDNTILDGIASIYLRKSFDLSDVSQVKEAILHMDYDDAFVAYLNGVEIARENITTDGAPAFDAVADNSTHEAYIFQGGVPDSFLIENIESLLVDGTNVLAVQVHNAGGNSSDLSAIPFLSLAFTSDVSGSTSSLFNFPQKKMHTDFGINADGETLYLFKNGVLIDSIMVAELPIDNSYGVDEAGDMSLKYFTQPTPEAVNNTPAYSSLAGKVTFSILGGIYTDEIHVELIPDHIDDRIYYTTDGTEPTDQDQLYSEAIIITSTTMLRAAVINENGVPGYVYTQSYFYGVEHDLPIISLVTEPDNFFDDNIGIYVNGVIRHPLSGKDCDNGQNFWQDWERPVHVSMIKEDGTLAFEQNAGVKVFGGCSRTFAQKSLSLRFRKAYGKSSLKYKVFDDLDINKYYSLNLRNSGNDWNGTMFRDGLLTNLFPKQLDKQAFKPAVVYINGAYWGIHNMRERIEDEYIEAHHDVKNSSVNMMEFHVNFKLNEVKGDGQRYLDLLDYLETTDIASSSNYEVVKEEIDVTNFALYQACNIAIRNTDWPGNNVKFWSSPQSDERWRWIVYDLDFGFQALNHNTLTFALDENGPDWPNPPASTYLLRKMLTNNDFQNLFINAFADVFNTLWKPEYITPIIDKMKDDISGEIQAHMERWGGNYGGWSGNVNGFYSYANSRPDIVIGHIEDYFELAGQYTLTLNVSDQAHGTIHLNTIEPEIYPWKGNYFKEVPITLIAKPKTGYRFVRWRGNSVSSNDTIVVDRYTATSLTADFEVDDDYSGIVTINEVFYSNLDSITPDDWVELYNSGSTAVDVSNWILKDDNDEHRFVFPAGATILPDSFIVIARDTAAFNATYANRYNVVGEMGFGLGDNSDQVRLYNHQEILVDSMDYYNHPQYQTTKFSYQRFIENDTIAWAFVSGMGTPMATNTKDIVDSTTDRVFNGAKIEVYPNPVRDVLTVNYSVATSGYVSIRLMSQNGTVVQILEDGYLFTGDHTLRWHGASGLASGVYILQLKNKAGIISEKVVKL